ncbi:hypothetical protein PCE1_000149 [Barthelona sp. PCE]
MSLLNPDNSLTEAHINFPLFVLSAVAYLVPVANMFFFSNNLFYSGIVGQWLISGSIVYLYVSFIYNIVVCVMNDKEKSSFFIVFRAIALDLPIIVGLNISSLLHDPYRRNVADGKKALIFIGFLLLFIFRCVTRTAKSTLEKLTVEETESIFKEWKEIQFYFHFHKEGRLFSVESEFLDIVDETVFDVPTCAPICIVCPHINIAPLDDECRDYEKKLLYKMKQKYNSTITKREFIRGKDLKNAFVAHKSIPWFSPIFYFLFVLLTPYYTWYAGMIQRSACIYNVSLKKKYIYRTRIGSGMFGDEMWDRWMME